MTIVEANYLHELREEKPLQLYLNRVFVGSPGTGKTTVAKLYGQILADLGVLSKGDVIIKNPADFMGPYLGQTETRTKAILQATVCKVLIIDEAYALNSKDFDSYKTAVVDTLVAEIQAVPEDDRCVLLLGYEDKLTAMFQNVNPEHWRRSASEDPFRFEDYTSLTLLVLVDLMKSVKPYARSGTEKSISIL